MKLGTIIGVLGAAAAVAAIMISAPARAADLEPPRAAIVVEAPAAQPAAPSPAPPEPSAWLLTLAGLLGLGVVLRAGHAGMTAT